MTTKSIVLTAVAAAGMVANAEVWDIKFSLKTVDNNKKTSVKIVGAYDDSTAGKYSFWYNKGAALKNVEFATDNVTSYGRSNKAQNAQLVWGDVSSPDGILIAGGFGSARSTSGQVAGMLGGIPASGTWTMKRSTKSFDALAKQAADVAANLAQEAAVKAYLDGAKSAAEVMAGKADTDAKIAELTADAEKTAAELATAKADVEAAAAKVAAAEADAKAAADKVAAAQADAAAATEANEELKKAIADLEAATNVLSEAVANLNDVTNNQGLVERTVTGYQQDVTDYIGYKVSKFWAEKNLKALDKNVTNAVAAVSNLLDKAQADLVAAQVRYDDMVAFDERRFDDISFAKDFIAETNNYTQITNETWRNAQLAAGSDLANGTNDTYTAWKGAGGAYEVYTNATALLDARKKDLKDAKRSLIEAGSADTAYWQGEIETISNDVAKLQKDADAYKATNDVAEAEYNAALAKVQDFVAKKDIAASEAKQKDLEGKLNEFKAECGAYTVDAFHNEEIPGQEKAIQKLNDDIAEAKTAMQVFADEGVVASLTGDYALPPFDQKAWDDYYKANVDDVKANVAKWDDLLAIKASNIKAWKDLATIIKAEDRLNDAEWIADLQKDTFKYELDDKDEAPVVVAAAAEFGIELKSTVK